MINNSDIIYIGAASAAANGDISFSYPDNDVTESRGVQLLPADGARTNVLEFTGEDAYMNVGNGLLAGSNANAFTIEVNLALSAGEQNVTLFDRHDEPEAAARHAVDHEHECDHLLICKHPVIR